jgi:hypothetical protein
MARVAVERRQMFVKIRKIEEAINPAAQLSQFLRIQKLVLRFVVAANHHTRVISSLYFQHEFFKKNRPLAAFRSGTKNPALGGAP